MTNGGKCLVAFLLLCGCPAGPAAAQNPPTANPAPVGVSSGERGTRLVLLGTGAGPLVRRYRSAPASVLVVDGRPYLIDVGSGTDRMLVQAGFQPSDITRVFLTHLHFDHTGGLATLLGYNWSSGKRQPVEIIGPPGTRALADGAVAYLKGPEDLYTAIWPPVPTLAQMFRSKEIDLTNRTLVFQDDRLRVFAVENSHYATIPEAKRRLHNWRSYSYRFETADRIVVFSGDTGPSSALTELARGADILVTEVISIDETIRVIKEDNPGKTEAQLGPLLEHQRHEHIAPEDIGKMAAAAGVKLVVLTHLAPGMDDERSTAPYTAGVRKHYSGIVVAGQDLDQF